MKVGDLVKHRNTEYTAIVMSLPHPLQRDRDRLDNRRAGEVALWKIRGR
jgi:hypothetical protein